MSRSPHAGVCEYPDSGQFPIVLDKPALYIPQQLRIEEKLLGPLF